MLNSCPVGGVALFRTEPLLRREKQLIAAQRTAGDAKKLAKTAAVVMQKSLQKQQSSHAPALIDSIQAGPWRQQTFSSCCATTLQLLKVQSCKQ